VYFNLFSEVEPFAAILIARGTLSHFGPTKSLENASSGRKCRTQYLICFLSTGGPVEPLDTTGGILRFRGTLVEKHWYRHMSQGV